MSGTSGLANINSLLEKTSDWDKDERYMATNDLCNLLIKDVKLDENIEQRICAAVLKQLDDQSNDVQSVAVKCLAILIKKVQKAQIGSICTKLCSLILDGKGALRDVYSIGLKTLIADVPDMMGSLVCDSITVRLLRGITSSGVEDVQRECLDNMSDLLRRFGQFNVEHHHDIMTGVVQQLDNDKAVIRKRAAACLGSLAVVSSDSLLNSLVQQVLDKIESNAEATAQQNIRTLIQSIGTISRMVGYRLGRHLPRIVPLFLRFCGDPEDEGQHTDAANELREHCFPGLESFVLRCPKEVAPFLAEILKTALAFMRYDPNYAYDDDDEEAAMDVDGDDSQQDSDAEADEEDDDYDEDEYGGSDDDDTSWKVRKAAVKVVNAVITSRPDMQQELFDQCGVPLIQRFKEREENVRLDIIKCFACFVNMQLASASNSSMHTTSNSKIKRGITGAGPGSSGASRAVQPLLSQLQAQVPAVVTACCTQLKGGPTTSKSKSAVFLLLRSLVIVLNGGLELSLPKLTRLTEKCLVMERNQALKLDALSFLRTALELHNEQAFVDLDKLVEHVVAVVREDWYKIIAEALRTLSALVAVIRPASGTAPATLTAAQQNDLLLRIYNALLPRLEALDMDQEIKECAIAAAGKLFCCGGDVMQAQLPNMLQIFRKRLDNETTRSSTLKALTSIAQSRLAIDLSDFLASSAGELGQFLRQSSRTLKQLTLQTFDAIVQNPVTRVTSDVSNTIFSEVAALISDADLHLTFLCLTLIQHMLQSSAPTTADALHAHLYNRLLLLAKSSILQGLAQEALVTLFESIATAAIPGMTSSEMFELLYSAQLPDEELTWNAGRGRVLSSVTVTAYSGTAAADTGKLSRPVDLNKQALANLSKCIAVVLVPNSSGDTAADKISTSIARFTADLQQPSGSPTSSEPLKQLALLCLGEVGQRCDLSAGTAQLQELILACFESASEDTKLSAAYALGHIAVGNLPAFLPVILHPTTANSRQQYLLLAALKEVIVVFANKDLDFGAHLPAVLPVLLQQCHSEEESVRSMVAECLGVLTSADRSCDHVIPVLLQLLASSETSANSNNAPEVAGSAGGAAARADLSRRMIAHALRFTLSRRCSAHALAALTEVIPRFLVLLRDADLEVKKAALLMVNTAVHHYPQTIETQISANIVPVLIETLQIKMERIVDLGPFKHRVDDNMPLRKASLTCIETTLEVAPEHLGDLTPIVQVLPLLLADKDEIKLQTHQILGKLCAYGPGVVVGQLDLLIPPLSKTVFKRPAAKSDANGGTAAAAGATTGAGPEAERALDLVKSGLRAVLSVERGIEDAAQISRKWLEFTDKVKRDEYTAGILHAIEHERNNLD